ncbi:helix-turn-helix domain-containing protein, partial [Waltera sp.]
RQKTAKYTDLNIIEIAYSLGFSKPSYFCRIFKKAYNLSPGKYRKDSPDE